MAITIKRQSAAIAIVGLAFIVSFSQAASNMGAEHRTLRTKRRATTSAESSLTWEQKCAEDFYAFESNEDLLHAAAADLKLGGDGSDFSSDSVWGSSECALSLSTYAESCIENGGTFCRANVKSDFANAKSSIDLGTGICLPPSCGDDFERIEQLATTLMLSGEGDVESYYVELHCDDPEEACTEDELNRFNPAQDHVNEDSKDN